MVVFFWGIISITEKTYTKLHSMEKEDSILKQEEETTQKKKEYFSVLPILFFLTSVFFFFTFCTYKCSGDKSEKKQEISQADSVKRDLESFDDEIFRENVSSETSQNESISENTEPKEEVNPVKMEDFIIERLSGVKVMMNLFSGKETNGEKKLRVNAVALFLFCLPLFGMIITGADNKKKKYLFFYSSLSFLIIVVAILVAYSTSMKTETSNTFGNCVFAPFINKSAFSNLSAYFDYRVLFLFIYWIFAVLFGVNLKHSWRNNAGIIIAIIGSILTIILGYLLHADIPEKQVESGVYLELNFGFYAIAVTFFITAVIGWIEKRYCCKAILPMEEEKETLNEENR